MLVFGELSLLTLLHLAVAVPVCGHILLRKRPEAVAVGWMAMVLLSPVVGVLLYWLFGINRIESYARRHRGRPPNFAPRLGTFTPPLARPPSPQEREVFQFAQAIHDRPFLSGNSVDLLMNGDAAYPVMLEAINSAKSSIALSVYIFDFDPAGKQFISALIAAHRRGVVVRILADDIGLRYSRRAVDREFVAAGVPVARFVPRRVRFLPFLNLRNHRKLLIIDGTTAFIGGMNIRHGHVLSARPRHPVRDIHFRVSGPVIDQINDVFENDWWFAAGDDITLPQWQASAPDPSGVLARMVPDGPDDNFEKLQWIILGALAFARERVKIMTPYFLPNQVIASALMVAVLRGVAIDVIVPRRSNIIFMDWAMAAKFEPLLEHGVKIYASPRPFDHSKLMVVDGSWVLVGSTNWDQRSLRLNFEVNLECYDPGLGAALEAYFESRRATCRPIERADLTKETLAVRLRNSFVGLFSPYL